MPHFTYPLLIIQVPHQSAPRGAIARSRDELQQIAIDVGGPEWSFPGHYSNPAADDHGHWVDSSTEPDWMNAISHDMHCVYFITESDFQSWLPSSQHQAHKAIDVVIELASLLNWHFPG